MKDILKIVKSFEDSGLLIKSVSETIQNKTKGQKGGFCWYAIRYTRCKFTRKHVVKKRVKDEE